MCLLKGITQRIKIFQEKHPRFSKAVKRVFLFAAALIVGSGYRALLEFLPENESKIIENYISAEKVEKAMEEIIKEAVENEEFREKLLEATEKILEKNLTQLKQEIIELQSEMQKELRDEMIVIREALNQLQWEMETKARINKEALVDLKFELDKRLYSIEEKLETIKAIQIYYKIPESKKEIIDRWRLPEYFENFEEIYVEDENRKNVLQQALELIEKGMNIVILGDPGVGKTTTLYKILLETAKKHNIGLLKSGKGLELRIHEKEGVILFIDDLSQQDVVLKELSKINKVKGLVASARTQE